MGKKQNGAQAQSEPGCRQQAGGLTHQHGGHQDEKEPKAAPEAVGRAESQANERQQRKERVDTHLDAHPTAQRN